MGLHQDEFPPLIKSQKIECNISFFDCCYNSNLYGCRITVNTNKKFSEEQEKKIVEQAVACYPETFRILASVHTKRDSQRVFSVQGGEIHFSYNGRNISDIFSSDKPIQRKMKLSLRSDGKMTNFVFC